MADINCSTLQTEIETQLAAITTSTCNKDTLLLSDAHLRVSVDQSNTVACTALLPNIDTCNFPPGLIVFDVDANCHVVSGEKGWYDMDACLVRQDVAISSAYTWGNAVTGCSSFNGLGLLNSNQDKSSPVSITSDIEWKCITSSFGNGIGIDVNDELYTWGPGMQGSVSFEPTNINDNFYVYPDIKYNNKSWTDIDAGYGIVSAISDGCVIYFDRGAENFCMDYANDWMGGEANFYAVCPAAISTATQVTVGSQNTLVLKQNKTIVGWGCNGYGELGNNSTAPVTSSSGCSSPVSVVGGFTDWCNVEFSSFAPTVGAIRENGTLWMWGTNFNGQLGIGNYNDQSSPVSVVGGFTDWCAVSIGLCHTAAVRSNGTAWGWGYAGSGRLGNNSTSNETSPVSVVGGFTDWCLISAGGDMTFGIRSNGRLYGWGSNSYGQLGIGDTDSRSSPVEVAGAYTDWCYVDANLASAVAIRYILP